MRSAQPMGQEATALRHGRSWRTARAVLAVLALVGLLYVLWSTWDSDAILGWKRQANPFWFFAAMAIVPAFGMPTTPFYLLAGTTFGVRIGLLGSAIALGLNLALCYWIAGSGLRQKLEWLLRRFSYDLPDFRQNEQGTVRFTLAVKLAPGLPAFVKNYVLGLVGVPFAFYWGASMVITGAYAAAFVIVGESLLQHHLSQAAAAATALLVLALGLWSWQRRRGHHARP